MINKILIAGLALFTMLILSCGNGQRNKLIRLNHIKDVELAGVPSTAKQVHNSNTFDTAYFGFSYLCPFEYIIGFVDLSNTASRTDFRELVNLNKIPLPENITEYQFFVYSLDSVYIVDQEKKVLWMYDKSMKALKEYRLSNNYAPAMMFNYNFNVVNNVIYYTWLPGNSNFARKTDRIDYYRSFKPVCKVSLVGQDDSLLYTVFGNFPNAYIRTGNNYYDYFPDICIDANYQIIVSYGASDNIFIYKNNTLIDEKTCKSNYIESFEDIPDDKYKDLGFLRVYLAEEPRYKGVVYDRYRNLYYRRARLEYDMEKNSIKHAQWSLIVMNASFDVLGEVLINSSEYMSDIVLPSKDGLYLRRTPRTEKEYLGNCILSLVELAL